MDTSLLTVGTFGAALLLAALDWIAVWREDRRRRYVFKPVAMVAVIAAAALLVLNGRHDPWQSTAFLLGFAFSLAGDIFLLFPATHHFILGLVSFLVAHLCYIVGLNQTLPPLPALVLLLPALLGWALLFTRIRNAMRGSRHEKLIPAVAIYSVIITVMLLSAWAALFRSNPNWPLPRQVLVVIGASLFFISDSILAWNRFVRRLHYGDLAVMVTYHLGQIALASSLAFSA